MKKELLCLFAGLMAAILMAETCLPDTASGYDSNISSFSRETVNDPKALNDTIENNKADESGYITHEDRSAEDHETIIIDSVDQLINNIGSNRTIIIKDGI